MVEMNEKKRMRKWDMEHGKNGEGGILNVF
jgi:hypothetical protein